MILSLVNNIIDLLGNGKEDIKSKSQEFKSDITSTALNEINNLNPKIDESLKLLKNAENQPPEQCDKLASEAASLLGFNVENIENLTNKTSDLHDRQILKEIRNKAERMWRLTLLLAPSDPEFEATLMWAAEKGEETELITIQQLQNTLQLASLQKSDDSLFYNCQGSEPLIHRAELKIKERILAKTQFLYKVLCSRDELNRFLGKVITVEIHSGSIDILASEEIIADIKQLFRVEQLIQVVSMPINNQVIRFNTTVNKDFKKRIEKTGAKILQPLSRLEIVVSVPNDDVVNQLRNIEDVIQITPYTPKINVKPQFLQHLGQPATKETIAAARLSAAKNPPSSDNSNIALPGIFIANFFTSEDRDRAAENLDNQGIHIANKPGKTKLVLDLTSDSNAIESIKKIVKQIGLQSLGEKSIPKLYNCEACNVIAKGVIPSNPTPTLGLTGKGEIIAIADTGLDTGELETLHLDFRGRINWINSYPIQPSLSSYVNNPGDNDGASDVYEGHGTHVAGSALGSGEQAKELQLSPIPKGVASEAQLVFQAIEQTPKWNQEGQFLWLTYYRKNPPKSGLFGIPDDLEELFEDAYDQGARIHSNSWGGGEPGVYGERSQSLDQFVWEHKDFLVLVAAGNDGRQTSSATQGIDQESITSPGTAKNCLTVGASENRRNGQFLDTYGQWWQEKFPHPPFNSDGMVDFVDDIAAFSSRGPCKDGRRKPDVIAPGTFILSTRSSQIPNNNFAWGAYPPAKDYYMYMGGTSMATPLVAGCAALVRQYFKKIHQPSISNPSAALVKAILIHSAQYIKYRFAHPSSRPWADNEQGWGRVDLHRVLNPAEPTKVIFIDESNGLETEERKEYQIEIKDNTVALRATLVYTDYPGENLINNLNLIFYSPSGKNYFGNDFEENGQPDNINNVEGVVIQSPEIGLWTVVVNAEATIEEQDYALVISGGGLKTI